MWFLAALNLSGLFARIDSFIHKCISQRVVSSVCADAKGQFLRSFFVTIPISKREKKTPKHIIVSGMSAKRREKKYNDAPANVVLYSVELMKIMSARHSLLSDISNTKHDHFIDFSCC